MSTFFYDDQLRIWKLALRLFGTPRHDAQGDYAISMIEFMGHTYITDVQKIYRRGGNGE